MEMSHPPPPPADNVIELSQLPLLWGRVSALRGINGAVTHTEAERGVTCSALRWVAAKCFVTKNTTRRRNLRAFVSTAMKRRVPRSDGNLMAG
jgi:hypothetical protein